ncbi:UNVERIFIED_CONTAM: hypothetical protein PYX00_003519 [Menopon gallinae]|uniref:Ensconsin-like n=1 Tax=Menopon gallinae TaxID=328185 RepID=A0AAW2I0C3_9NEOP
MWLSSCWNNYRACHESSPLPADLNFFFESHSILHGRVFADAISTITESFVVFSDSREEKLRLVRERQAEERQRRLEELKRHALEAQQFREQKEIERRRRMEDSRQKENERRTQVEERKRQIWEAEKERREAIVRKNQERDARIDAKRKNERSSIVFAFGSSTPRMLETSDSHCFWGPRRATSTANLRLFPTVPLSRRTPERELEPKKRASSAGGLYRNPGDLMSTSMYEVFHWDSQPAKPRLSLAPQTDPSLSVIDAPVSQSVPQTPVHPKQFVTSKGVRTDGEENTIGTTVSYRAARRKTDLMPTIPSPRDGISSSRPTSGTRSLARTPGRAYSVARLDILAQPRVVHTPPHFSQTLSGPTKSMSRSTNHLVESKQFQSNTLSKSDTSKSMMQLQTKGSSLNFLQPRMTRAQRLRNRARAAAASASSSKSLSPDGHLSPGDLTPSRPGSVLSQYSVTSASTPTPRLRQTPRRPRPLSIHVTGISKDKEKILSPEEKPKPKEVKESKVAAKPSPPVRNSSVTKKQNQQRNEEIKKTQTKITDNNKTTTLDNNLVENNKINETSAAEKKSDEADAAKETPKVDSNVENKLETVPANAPETVTNEVNNKPEEKPAENAPVATEKAKETPAAPEGNGAVEDESAKAMTASRSKITTEEEAKAALAERRRLAREQAEREAEAERLRLELEAQKEAERIRKEEEEQRLAEEEQLRLLEEARRMEELRLMQAIEETRKKEEEERERKQQEELARLEKEEQERKAREEAEK